MSIEWAMAAEHKQARSGRPITHGGRHLPPTFLKLAMPEWEVSVAEKLPDSVLFDILVLVKTTFPPLGMTPWMGLND